jgi:acetyl esterase
MSSRSKYPDKYLLTRVVLVMAALVVAFGTSSLNTGEAVSGTLQNNSASPSSDNASDYFVFQSQQDLFNAVKTGKAEEMFAKIGQATSEIKMASITDYNISGSDRNNDDDDNNTNNTTRVRFYDPGIQSKPAPLLIYLYGRSGEERNMDSSDPGLKILANSTGFMVATMDYRFAPFTDSLDDILSTIHWIHQNSEQLGVDSQRIALGGESRGANLALSTALVLRDSANMEDRNLIRVLYLLNGYYSPHLLESRSAKMFGNGSDLITSADIEMIFDQIYQNASSDYTNPLAFPLLYKSLTRLPPIYIVASGIDPLKDESIDLAERLSEEGQEYYLAIWPGVGHSAASFNFTPVIPDLQRYQDSMTGYLREVLTVNQEQGGNTG